VLEIVVTASTAGKGTLWIDDLTLKQTRRASAEGRHRPRARRVKFMTLCHRDQLLLGISAR
jgi:hypothetical protein